MPEPRIHLEGAREKPLGFSGETTLSVADLGGDPLVSLSPVRMSGVISRVDEEYLIDGELAWSGELTCSRCVSPYAFAEALPLHLRLRKRPAPAKPEKGRAGEEEEESEMDPGELDVVFYDEPILPFDEIAREQVLMALPMKPLCREDCRGLCPQCGKDWNVAECSCESPVDPRLEVLKNLKQEV
ncbi:MAG TPA: DUF177 domain-containing protein [Thermoanaerobaculia bacterium]|nr:DUF177 domain-containing protein [Thermoanaerobaculia bacterium]